MCSVKREMCWRKSEFFDMAAEECKYFVSRGDDKNGCLHCHGHQCYCEEAAKEAKLSYALERL